MKPAKDAQGKGNKMSEGRGVTTQESGPSNEPDVQKSPVRHDARRMSYFTVNAKPYPWAIILIIGSEFCERFSNGCFRSVLVLYFRNKLDYTDVDSTLFYHLFMMSVYFCCIIGATVSDSFAGKYWTILSLSIVYIIGDGFIAFAVTHIMAVIPPLVLGLSLIALGTGGIKSCCASFGGEQFDLPAQEKQFRQYFGLFYFSIKLGILISFIISPIIRAETSCFNDKDCEFAAFANATAIMVIGTVVFACGKSIYVIYTPTEVSTIIHVPRSIFQALMKKMKRPSSQPAEAHFMDYVKDDYGENYITNVKGLLKVLLVCFAFPMFWALFEQQGSTWTIQATKLDGNIGAFHILPEQVQLLNPALLMLIIPLFEVLILPLLVKCIGDRRPLKIMTVGAVFMCLAFVAATILEYKIHANEDPAPEAGYSQLRIFNGYDCNLQVSYLDKTVQLGYLDMHVDYKIPCKNSKTIALNWTKDGVQSTCDSFTPPTEPVEMELKSNEANSIFISSEPEIYKDKAVSAKNEQPLLRILTNIPQNGQLIFVNSKSGTVDLNMTVEAHHASDLISIEHNIYKIYIDDKYLTRKLVENGGVYTLVVSEDVGRYVANMIFVVSPNNIEILWMLPQYILLTFAEATFVVTGLEFMFTEAPKTMRSLLQAVWLLNIALGNLIYVAVTSVCSFENATYSFLLFTCLMVLDVILFLILSRKYKYSDRTLGTRGIL